jgi:hypothetical protein
MRPKLSWCLLLLLVPFIALSSCGGGGGGGSSSSILGGIWTGTWASTNTAGLGSTLVLSIVQSKTTLTGTATVHDTPYGDMDGDITGNISDADGAGTLSIVIETSDGDEIVLSGNYTKTTMSGDYTYSGDRGLFNLAK